MRRLAWVAALGVAVSIGTWSMGWWAPAVVSVLAGYVLAEEPLVPSLAGLGAAAGWGIVLAVDAMAGRLEIVARTMGAIFNRGPAPLIVLTLLVPLLLGLTGAELGRWLRVHLGGLPTTETRG